MKGDAGMREDGQENSPAEAELLRRVKRLERINSILWIDITFLWLVLFRSTGTIKRAVEIFKFVMGRLDLIG